MVGLSVAAVTDSTLAVSLALLSGDLDDRLSIYLLIL